MLREIHAVRGCITHKAVLLVCSLCTLLLFAFPGAAQSGQPDIVFQNQSTGQVVDWLMTGTTFVSYALLPDPGSVNWKIVGSGDFDGDGKPDLLFQNQQTGQLVYWIMNETALLRWGYINPSLPGPIDWKVAAVADLDHDGMSDILFQNQRTGELVYWKMNGTILGSYGFLPNPGSPSWKLVGAADLNADGSTDLLFQNQQTGAIVYWLMNRTSFVSYGFLPDPGSPNWKVAGIGDFNGDGKPDLLFQNQSTGQLVYWLMNGVSLVTFGYITPNNPGANWKVAVVWAAQSGSASGIIQ